MDFLWESSHPTSKQEILKERPVIDPHPPKAISNPIDFSGGGGITPKCSWLNIAMPLPNSPSVWA